MEEDEPRYEIHWNGPDKSFSWTDENGVVHDEQMHAGDVLPFNSACDMLAFIDAAVGEGERYASRDDGATRSSLQQACSGTTTETVLGEAPAAHPAPQPAPDRPETTGTDDRPTDDTEPPPVDAPDPEPGVEARRTVRGDDGRTLEEQAHDREPRDTGELADDLRRRGVAEDDIESELERIRRNEASDGLPHYQFGRNDTERRTPAADPVDLATGTFGLDVTDVAIPTRGTVPLELRRVYRSGAPYYGPWGYNWDHNYNVHARPLADGAVAIWTGAVSEDVYTVQADGSFEPPLGQFRALVHEPATVGRPERYVLTDLDGTTRVFARPAGWPHADRVPLVRIEDRNHAGQDLAYDAEGRIAAVRDHADRGLDFAYGGCGLLERVTDHTGRAWAYYHDTDEAHLVAVIGPPTAEAPSGPRTIYEYDKLASHPLLRHNLTRIIDPDERVVVVNTYGQDPSTDDFARVVTQDWAGSRADFRATVLQDVPRIASAINLPVKRVEVIVDGQYRVYTFNFRGDLLDERCRLIRDGSYRLWVRVFEYDHRGNQVMVREPDGTSLRLDYDADNADPRARQNLVRVTREASPLAAAPDRVLVEAEYEPVLFQLSRVRDEAGHETRLIYDHEELPAGVGNVIRVEHPDVALPDGAIQRKVERFTYDADGQIATASVDGGRATGYAYGGPGTPEAGLVARVILDPGGLALATAYAYDAWGHVTALLDPLGNGARFEYDAAGLLRRVLQPAAGEIRYDYDRSGHVVRIREPRGTTPADGTLVDPFVVTELEYDCAGRLRAEVRAANTAAPRRWQYCHDAWDRVVRTVDPLGRVTTTRFDERGRELETRFSPGAGLADRVTRRIFDRNGRLTAEISPGDRRTEYDYDAWDRPIRVRVPAVAGVATEYRYDYGRNDLLTAMSIVGVPRPGVAPTVLYATAIAYDARGRSISVARDGDPTTLWWSVDDDLVAQTDVAGGEVAHGYDAAGRLVATTDPAGNRVELVPDAAGRVITVRTDDALAAGGRQLTTMTLAYDAAGRVVTRTDPRGAIAATEYDDRGLARAIVDPLGNRIEVDCDVDGEVCAQRWISTGTAVAWDRDLVGRLVAYTDPLGAITRYDHDPYDQLTATRYTDGSVERRAYSPAGDLAGVTAPDGSVTTFVADAAGRTARIDYAPAAGIAATPSTTIGYDGLDRVVRAEHGAIVVEREYDRLGRPISEVVDGRRCELAYDDAHRRFEVTYPDGRRDAVTLDSLRRPIAVALAARGAAAATAAVPVGTTLVSYAYDGATRPARRQLWNGLSTTFEYDAALRLRALAHAGPGGAAIARFENVYDLAGRRRLETATGGAPWTGRWAAHDPRGRLTAAVTEPALPAPVPTATSAPAAIAAYLGALGTPAGDAAWTVDLDPADGRRRVRLADAAGVTTDDYAVDAMRRITAIDTTRPDGTHAVAAVAHDGAGRRSADRARRYVHDARDLVVRIEDAVTGGVLARFTRDGFGRIIEIDETGRPVERSAWIADRRIHDDVAGGGVIQRAWAANAAELAVISDGANRWVAQDQRWSTVALGDDAGGVIERHGFDPLGGAAVRDGAGAVGIAIAGARLRPRFAGHDLIGGIYLGPVRGFDAATGAFLERDPGGYADSPNPYAYAGCDPIDNVDVTSRWVESAWDIFSLGVGIYSAVQDAREGNWGWFALDCVGIVLDTAALILPLVPGGVGAAVKAFRAGTAAVRVGSNAWRTGRIVSGTVNAGRWAYRLERGVQTARMAESGINIGRGAYTSYDQFSQGNYGTGMLGLGMTVLGARGMVGRWYNLPRVMRPLTAAEQAFFPAGVRYPRYEHLPSRAFGDRARLLFSGNNQYRWWQMFYDPREFSAVSQQYWRGNARGLSLQHTYMLNSGGNPLRNAGLNFVEVAQRLNSWMGDDVWRNRAFRLQVLTYMGAAGTASYETTREVIDRLSGAGPDRPSQTK